LFIGRLIPRHATLKQREALILFRGVNVETAKNLRAYCAVYRRLANHPFHKQHRELLLDLAQQCEMIAHNMERMAQISDRVGSTVELALAPGRGRDRG
jgi:hypothetical protein